MKQIIKLFSVLILSTIVKASSNWVPTTMGDIITFVASVPFNEKSTLTSYKANYNAGESIWIQIDDKRNINSYPKDWIGIYPKNSNNDWDNVLDWKFVKDKSDTQFGGHNWYEFDGLSEGAYEARVFFRNPYRIEASYAFTVKRNNVGNARIILIGDSTVYNTVHGERGWGTALIDYMYKRTLYNRARAGSSTKSFRKDSPSSEHDWKHTKELMKGPCSNNGSFLLIQFGHNDENIHATYNYAKPGRNEAYYNGLKEFVHEARMQGVTPVLVTPVSRLFVNNRTHKNYVETMKYLAEDANVLLLDLEEKSYKEFGKYSNNKKLRTKFGHDDKAHFNPVGAHIIAGWVKELACKKSQNLCSQFK